MENFPTFCAKGAPWEFGKFPAHSGLRHPVLSPTKNVGGRHDKETRLGALGLDS